MTALLSTRLDRLLPDGKMDRTKTLVFVQYSLQRALSVKITSQAERHAAINFWRFTRAEFKKIPTDNRAQGVGIMKDCVYTLGLFITRN